jgi:16S rRNA (guanine966-N2)-methyltransferase
MRVISGSARGRRLKAPTGRLVRPTSDRVKESVFDLLGLRWDGCRVMDLFAGSGALGIEALSRGAGLALFVEADRSCVSVLVANLRSCALEEKARVIRGDAVRFLRRRGGFPDFHVVFADPPYERGLAWPCVVGVGRGRWLAPGGVLVLEHSRRELFPDQGAGLALLDRRSYGGTLISLYGWGPGQGEMEPEACPPGDGMGPRPTDWG